MNASSSPRLTNWPDLIRPTMRDVATSGIVEVFNYGRGRQGLIPLWVGEGDLPTPPFISEAAKTSLDRGETFYTWQNGVPELREAIAAYMTQVYGAAPGGVRFLAREFLCDDRRHARHRDRDPAHRRLWRRGVDPDARLAQFRRGARNFRRAGRARPLDKEGRWSLDPAKLEKAVTPATRLIFFNSPANPTGFVATREEIVETLAIARRHGLWIIADEIYGRLTYDGVRAPSFHDVMASDDKILFVQTLSKNWAMTGFRIGWLEAPPELGYVIENLVQYTTSGVPVFTQRAATAALEQGETFLAWQIERCRRSRDILCEGFAKTGRVRFFKPDAAFYLFFSIDGFSDSTRACAQAHRRSRCWRRARGRLRPRRRGPSAYLLRSRSRTDRRSDTAYGSVAWDLNREC